MHRCVRCGSVYEDNDVNILRGCASCGGIFFLYVKGPGDVTQLDAVNRELQSKDTSLEEELAKQIEKRKSELAGAVSGTVENVEAVKEAEEGKEIEFIKEAKTGRRKMRKARKLKKAKAARREKAKEAEAVTGRKSVVTIGGKKFAVEDLFGIETIRVPKDGVYEINIDALMKRQPVIVLERGQIYVIHLPDVFEAVERK